MPPTGDLAAGAQPEALVADAGRVVVCGASAKGVEHDVVRTVRHAGLSAAVVQRQLTPRQTSASTRAVVFVVDDADAGMRACEELRQWAHESLLPILVVFSGDDASQALPLWEFALVVVRSWELDSVLSPLLTALGSRPGGLPEERDAEIAWEGRCVLAELPWAAYGHGLATFAAAGTLFVGGLAPNVAAAQALCHGLDVPRAQTINFVALRVWTTPSTAQPGPEGPHEC